MPIADDFIKVEKVESLPVPLPVEESKVPVDVESTAEPVQQDEETVESKPDVAGETY